jgi:hypothetical protein
MRKISTLVNCDKMFLYINHNNVAWGGVNLMCGLCSKLYGCGFRWDLLHYVYHCLHVTIFSPWCQCYGHAFFILYRKSTYGMVHFCCKCVLTSIVFLKWSKTSVWSGLLDWWSHPCTKEFLALYMHHLQLYLALKLQIQKKYTLPQSVTLLWSI